jgi:hypothetical protein
VDATRAVVLIHEFRTPRVDDKNLAQNRADLVRFLRRLGVDEPGRPPSTAPAAYPSPCHESPGRSVISRDSR